MPADFNARAGSSGEAEAALRDWGIYFERKPDGSLFVPGNMSLDGKELDRLPDLSRVDVGGNLWLGFNRLTSMRGAPRSVAGDIDASHNLLTSLAGAPETVGGSFYCAKNRLSSLAGAPRKVGAHFSCYDNPLASLEGAPSEVGGWFVCVDCGLASLEGAPRAIGGEFHCRGNKLASLEGAPAACGNLISDFGTFPSWDEVPRDLRLSPETKAKKLEQAVAAAVVLRNPVRIGRPVRFRKS